MTQGKDPPRPAAGVSNPGIRPAPPRYRRHNKVLYQAREYVAYGKVTCG